MVRAPGSTVPASTQRSSLLRRSKLHYNPGVRIFSKIPVRAILTANCGDSERARLLRGATDAARLRRPNPASAPQTCDWRTRHTCRPGCQRQAYPSRHGCFFQRRQDHNRCHGRALFVAPSEPRDDFCLDRGSQWPCNEHNPGACRRSLVIAGSHGRAAGRLSQRSHGNLGHGFCGDADANRVTIGGTPALVLASSPAYLAVLPPEMDPGPPPCRCSAARRPSHPSHVVFVSAGTGGEDYHARSGRASHAAGLHYREQH